MQASDIDVFRYLDYREFLRDRYAAEKQRSPKFSYRYFSRRVGVRSPGHLKRVMDGERSLTNTMVERYAQAFGMSTGESQYFGALVSFNDAATSKDRERAYQALTGFRKYRQMHQLDLRQGDFCAYWYIPAIRELVVCDGFREDPQWVAAQLRPTISVKEAQAALDTLLELGLLTRDEDGRLRQQDATVSTGAQTQWVHVTRYHRAMLERASESIDVFPAAERDLSSVALALPKDALPHLKRRLAEFRKELLSDYSVEEDAERVVQVSMQMFPLSAEPEET